MAAVNRQAIYTETRCKPGPSESYCYIDPCSFMLTLPNIKLYHTKMEPLGDACCEFDLAIVSDEEMKTVLEPGHDYRDLDPIIKQGTKGPLLNHPPQGDV